MAFHAGWGTRMKYPKNPETAHNHTEIIYCREGDGTFFVEQEAFPVHAGDVIYVPAPRQIAGRDLGGAARADGIFR